MKKQIHNIATATISLAIITTLSSCKSEEEKRRETRQSIDEIMAPLYKQQRQQQEAQRRAEQDALIGMAGEVIGGLIQERNRQQNSNGGRQTQQEFDRSLQREYHIREFEKDKDRTIQKMLNR
jgi:hypothetical protein